MKHLVQRIVFIGVLLLVLLGLSVASAGAYDAGEVTGSDRMIAAPAASGGDMAGLQAIPGRILAADYDVGGEGVAYHDTTPGNIDSNPSSYRDDDVDIGIRDWDSDPLITNTAAGEWLRYTADVAEAGTYDVEYLLYTTQGGCTLALDVDGVSAHQIAVPEASSWRTAIRVKGEVNFSTAGEHVLILRLTGDMNLNGMTFSKKPSVPPTFEIPGRILAADYDAGGEGVAYHDTTPGNIDSNPSSYRDDDVDIGIRDWDSDPLVTNTAAGEWLRYTVDVAEAGTYDVEYLLYTTQAGCTLALDVDGASAHQIPVQEASSWRTAIRVKDQATFPTAGEHELTLQVSGDMNLNGMTFTGEGSASLDADFTASPTSGPAPLTVQFTDTSAGAPTAWFWTFGDGVTSTEQHPVHTYTTAGSYTVILTVDDAAGSDTERKFDCIFVDPPSNEFLSIAWQRCLGGSDGDRASSIQQTSDGGYIVAGSTLSDDGDVSGNHGDADAWVVKLDGDGKVLWQRCFGGSNSDSASSIQQTSDGEYIVAGETSSDDGDVSGNHGDRDAWVVKLDAAGKVLWQRCLGGSNLDSASSIQQTSDGGYIVAGETSSDDGDVSGNHGDRDAWLVKLDADGKIAWQRCLGGSIEDGARSVQQTVDGGYILAGYTESIDGDVSGNHGDRDALVVKLDDGGEISWQRCLGGSGWDDASSIQQTSDGGYILAAETWSYDGDVIGNHGWYDAWVVNMDPDGAISWQRCLGGEGSDGACSVQQTSDGGYIVSGSVKYYENDRIRTRLDPPPVRALVVKLNADGAVAWHKELGGRWYGYSVGSSVQQTVDRGYIIAGTTYSDDGDVSGNHGDSDAWVVKLKSNGSMTTLDAAFTASPTSGLAPLTVQFTDTSTGTPTAWTWAFGDGATSTEQHPVHTYTDPGTYTVSLMVDDAAGSDTETKADYITVAAPAVSIAWQRCLGGSGSDVASIVQQTSDGGYIVAGSTESTDGDVGGNHGGYDIWVVKLDARGETAWQRCFGGSGTDVARSAHPTVDGGYIIGGQTDSTDGDVSGNHGTAEIWLVKMDSGGNISWQRCIGGSNYEDISNVCQTSDGGYILTGETDSNDGDVSGYHDRNDTWLVKIDPDGLIEWEKSFGPIMINTCAQQTDDGGYVLCGWCWEGHGMFDGYVLKVDATGVLEWQSYLGGYCRDYVSSIRQTGDSGYIAAGSTESSDIDGYHRDPENYDSIPDGMAVKINATGALEWQRGLGGYDSDTFRCVEQAADGGYILAGYTNSNDGDVSGNHGGLWDGWAVKLDSSGELEWQRCLGGSGDDKVQSVGQTSDGGYILAGSTDSNDGDVSGNHGASDIWVAKLENA